jgi:stage II sporulation protein AB (anti-sigma F factor)
VITNKFKLIFSAVSSNESFARVTAASFISQLDPTVEELEDVKTAVSEAVTNSIIHGYENRQGEVCLECIIEGKLVTIIITDYGKGIEDILLARQPLYTTKPNMERSGMGFTVMESFMDSVEVNSELGKGTCVILKKRFNSL